MKHIFLKRLLSIGCRYAQTDRERQTILINNILSFQNILSAVFFGLALYILIHPWAMFVIWGYVPFSIISLVLSYYGQHRFSKMVNIGVAVLFPLLGLSWINPVDAMPMYWIGCYYLAQVPLVALIFDYYSERTYTFLAIASLLGSYYLFPFFDTWLSLDYQVTIENHKIYQIIFIFSILYIIGSFLYYVNIHYQLNLKTLDLLKETDLQNKELQAQKEELLLHVEQVANQQTELERASSEIQRLQKSQLDELHSELHQRTQAINAVVATLEFIPNGQIHTFNSNFSKILHTSPEVLETCNFWDLFTDTKSKDDFIAFTSSSLRANDLLQREVCMKCEHRSVWISLTIIPFFETEGNVSRFLVVGFSVDALKSQEEYLRHSRENLQFYDEGLTNMTQLMRFEADQSAEDWAYQLLSYLTDYLGAFQSALYAIPKVDAQELHLLTKYCFSDTQELPKTVSFGTGVVGEVARKQEDILFSEEDETVQDILQIGGKRVCIKSIYILPLLVNEKTEGILILNSLENLEDKSLGLLEKLAPNIAVNLAGLRKSWRIKQLLVDSENMNRSLMMNEETLKHSLLNLEQKTQELLEKETQVFEEKDLLHQKNMNLEKIIRERTEEMNNKNTQLLQLQTELQKALQHKRHQYDRLRTTLRAAQAVIYYQTYPNEKLHFLTDNIEEVSGYSEEEIRLKGWTINNLISEKNQIRVIRQKRQAQEEYRIYEGGYYLKMRDNMTTRYVFERSIGIYNETNELTAWTGLISEITNIEKKEQEKYQIRLQKINEIVQKHSQKLAFTENKLIHAEKLSILGEQVAGIAHEINNPISFAHNGAESLETYWGEIRELLEKYEQLELQPSDASPLWQEIRDFKDEIEYEEVKEDLTGLSQDILAGTTRTLDIVRSMRNFARKNTDEIEPTDLHESLDSTLVILKNKYKHRIEIQRNYAPDLPIIPCFGGQINQVFMNLLANAIQAIPKKGEIIITTEKAKNEPLVWVKIQDTGIGMNPMTQKKIFETYFTTKPVNEGTGLGLAIVKSIVERHQGRIEVESQEGIGTEFRIALPLEL